MINLKGKMLLQVLLAVFVFAGVEADAAQELKQTKFNVDVIVIGSGAAGLSAAIEAKAHGASTAIVEKLPTVGGNSISALGSFAAVGSRIQKERGLHASPEAFYLSFFRHEERPGTVRPELVKRLVAESGRALDWLNDMGAGLTEVAPAFGTNEYREFYSNESIGAGAEIVKELLRQAENDDIPIFTSVRAEEIVLDSRGRVTGINAVKGDGTEIEVNARAVVIATGGYAAAHDILARFNPVFGETMTSNCPGSTGDGLIMLDALGAQLVDIGKVQFHPTISPIINSMIPESVRNLGGMLVDSEGRRFVNETADSDEIARVMYTSGVYKKPMFLIFDRKIADEVLGLEPTFNAGTYFTANDLESLARLIKVPYKNLRRSIAEIQNNKADGTVDGFGRSSFESNLNHYPVFAVKIRPAMHYTPGGVLIDDQARVLTPFHEPVYGLYAAGEVTGGINGSRRKGNTSLTEAVVFGRIAGINAADFVEKHPDGIDNLELNFLPKNENFGFLSHSDVER